MHRFYFALATAWLVGCSDPATKPIAVDEPCENRIVYRTSNEISLIGAYRYDETGNITRYVETNSTEKEVFYLSRSYDEHNRLHKQIIDTTRFDSTHREMTWEYDTEDRVTRTTYDGWGSNGSLRETRIYYDSQGRRDRMETLEDNTPTTNVKFVYLEGEPYIIEQRTHDAVSDVLQYGFRYELLQGRWLSRLEIFNAELVQTAEIYTYDDVASGKLVQRDLDLQADGIIDAFDYVHWNPSGLVERVEYDSDADGQPDDKYQFTYDSAGKLVLRTWDHPEHWVNISTKFEWADDHLTYVDRQDDTSGSSIESWSFEYGCLDELPMNVNIAPVIGFRTEMQTLAVDVDSTHWWRSWEAL